eukprot:8826521-Pyramimonas_sp.AAC.1
MISLPTSATYPLVARSTRPPSIPVCVEVTCSSLRRSFRAKLDVADWTPRPCASAYFCGCA